MIKLPQLNLQQIAGFVITLITVVAAIAGVVQGTPENGGSSLGPIRIGTGSNAPVDMNASRDRIFNDVNAYRSQNGKQKWSRNASLDQEAQQWADYIARTGDFQHQKITSGVENLFFSTSNPNDAFNSWRRSTGHNANMLSNTGAAGVGVAHGRGYMGATGYIVVLRAV